jgi:hypothetical protein
MCRVEFFNRRNMRDTFDYVDPGRGMPTPSAWVRIVLFSEDVAVQAVKEQGKKVLFMKPEQVAKLPLFGRTVNSFTKIYQIVDTAAQPVYREWLFLDYGNNEYRIRPFIPSQMEAIRERIADSGEGVAREISGETFISETRGNGGLVTTLEALRSGLVDPSVEEMMETGKEEVIETLKAWRTDGVLELDKEKEVERQNLLLLLRALDLDIPADLEHDHASGHNNGRDDNETDDEVEAESQGLENDSGDDGGSDGEGHAGADFVEGEGDLLSPWEDEPVSMSSQVTMGVALGVGGQTTTPGTMSPSLAVLIPKASPDTV